MAAAIISSYLDITIPLHTCFTGEIGLSGDVRAVNQFQHRSSEAKRLGYKNIFARYKSSSSHNNVENIKRLITFIGSQK
jgi:DNA repair protein RadA/Sms